MIAWKITVTCIKIYDLAISILKYGYSIVVFIDYWQLHDLPVVAPQAWPETERTSLNCTVSVTVRLYNVGDLI